jgi:IclR family pca regulon transcriptional regulator
MTSRHHVAALEKGLQVLQCFSRLHPRLTLSEVSRLAGCTPASARRSLLTLQALGHVASDGKQFWTTPRCLLLANAYLASNPIPALAQPLLDGLAERTRESASLAQLIDTDVIVVARSTARRSLSVGLRIGSRLPVYCSSLGRVLLAGLPRDEAVARLHGMPRPRLTPHTVVDADAAVACVDDAARLGYATTDQELEMGVRSMAVPVFTRGGALVAGLSIAVRAERFEMAAFVETFLPALQRAQARLAAQLG